MHLHKKKLLCLKVNTGNWLLWNRCRMGREEWNGRHQDVIILLQIVLTYHSYKFRAHPKMCTHLRKRKIVCFLAHGVTYPVLLEEIENACAADSVTKLPKQQCTIPANAWKLMATTPSPSCNHRGQK